MMLLVQIVSLLISSKNYGNNVKDNLLKVFEEFYLNGKVGLRIKVHLSLRKIAIFKVSYFQHISLITSVYKIISRVTS